MTHTLKFNTSQIDATHQYNMRASLAYRLEVARSARNIQLIETLEQEQQQLTANVKAQAVLRVVESHLKAIQRGVRNVFWGDSVRGVGEFRCGSDRWWYAVDSNTGEFLYADSEIELHATVEKPNLGR
jgi:sensor domain CHASE-containing protein